MLRLLLCPRRIDAYTFLPHRSFTRWSVHDIPSEHPHCRAGDIAEGQVVRVAWGDEGARFFVGGELRFKKVAWGGAPPADVRAVASMGCYAGSSATLAG